MAPSTRRKQSPQSTAPSISASRPSTRRPPTATATPRRSLGRALASRRKEIVLVTKCGLDWDANKVIYRDGSPSRIVGGLEESLRRLKTDWVDLFLVHWPDMDRPIEPTMRAMQDIVASGKARFVGVSNFNVEQMEVALKVGALQCHQMGYNLFDRRVGKEIMPFCARNGVGVMVYGSLSYGLLTGTWQS